MVSGNVFPLDNYVARSLHSPSALITVHYAMAPLLVAHTWLTGQVTNILTNNTRSSRSTYLTAVDTTRSSLSKPLCLSSYGLTRLGSLA